ncbi:glycoside hydrolase family 97 protein [Bacteroides xylanisolvens]|uniref:glycoside hydrolase family 97 protein n=1 Tax=Bacteroides xylanisolvens TaxID=371601 RepID=UPI003569D099
MKINYVIGAFLCVLGCYGCSSPKTEVKSPDGHIKMALTVDDNGKPLYNILVDDSLLIENSTLGFTEKNGIDLGGGFQIKNTTFDSKDETWTQPWGENKTNRNHYNEMAVNLVNKDQVELTLRFRVFDDGVGFRYEYNVPAADSLLITDELTTFRFRQDGTSWSIPASAETYELLYAQRPISEVETANTPFTFKTADGVYGSIHEAALYDFSEMTLKQAGNYTLKAELAPWPDGVKVRKGNHFTTSWRTIQIVPDAVSLINSAMILNLNEPSKIETTDWIRPMKYVGVWWGMHLGVETWKMDERHGATTVNAKKYIDFAATNQIEGVLFEGWNEGWESWGGMQNFDFTKPYADFDIDEVVRYAKEKGVEVIGHHETGGNIPNYERQMDHAMQWYTDHGIHVLKTGYAGAFPNGYLHHSQYGVNHYQKVVETAARHKMTLDAHEPIKDTGIRRTWPNMMTREGVRGMEWNAWSEGNPPSHHVMLPFTRMLSGPLDYTPGTFDILFLNTKDSPRRQKWNDQDKGNSRVNTTLAKQLANWVILYSPLQMASDMIENYEGHPAFQFFCDFDPDCDESKALAGEPGEFVAIVRKAKGNYFLGAATNEKPRTLEIKLDFLEPGKQYKAVIYADGENADWKSNPTDYRITEQTVTSENTLNIRMAAGGGQAISFMAL